MTYKNIRFYKWVRKHISEYSCHKCLQKAYLNTWVPCEADGLESRCLWLNIFTFSPSFKFFMVNRLMVLFINDQVKPTNILKHTYSDISMQVIHYDVLNKFFTIWMTFVFKFSQVLSHIKL